MLISLQKSILHRVARLLRTAKNAEQGAVDTPAVTRDEVFECIGVAALDFSNCLCVGIKGLFPFAGTVFRAEKIRDFRRGRWERDPGLEIQYRAHTELHCIQEVGEAGGDHRLNDLLVPETLAPKPGPGISVEGGGLAGEAQHKVQEGDIRLT